MEPSSPHVIQTWNCAAPNCATCGTKTKLTVRIDADLPREARVVAAEEGRSVAALLSALLADLVRGRKTFVKARRRALARLRPASTSSGSDPAIHIRSTSDKGSLA